MCRFRTSVQRLTPAFAVPMAVALLIAGQSAAQDVVLRGLKLGMSVDEATKAARLDNSADLITMGLSGDLFARLAPTRGAHALRTKHFPLFSSKDDKAGEDVLAAYAFPPRYAQLSQELARYKDKLVAITWGRALANVDKAKVIADLERAYGKADAQHVGAPSEEDATYHLLVWGAKLVPNRSGGGDAPTLYLVDSHRILLAEIVIPGRADKDRRLGLTLEAVDYDAIEHADTILKILNNRD